MLLWGGNVALGKGIWNLHWGIALGSARIKVESLALFFYEKF